MPQVPNRKITVTETISLDFCAPFIKLPSVDCDGADAAADSLHHSICRHIRY